MHASRSPIVVGLLSIILSSFFGSGFANARGRLGTGVVATAAQPGVASVGQDGSRASVTATIQQENRLKEDLVSGEGAGPKWCAAYGGYRLGAYFDGVYACGPATGDADPFDSVGFQCVELSERFLWVHYRKFVNNVPYGRDFVSFGHRQLGIPDSAPRVGNLPAVGDIVSLSGGSGSLPEGHTAVVTSVDVSVSGNGRVNLMEENGLASGRDYIRVSDWRESYGDPSFDGGYYYYDNVTWLDLAPAIPIPRPLPTRYSVLPLGPLLKPLGISDHDTITGVRPSVTAAGTIERPFTFKPGTKLRIIDGPRLASDGVAGISNLNTIAVSTMEVDGRTLAYAINSATKPSWRLLPPGILHATSDEVLSVDAHGDMSGWASNRANRQPNVGIVWLRRGGAYAPLALYAGARFTTPEVYSTDPFGDAVGTEIRGGSSYPLIWINGRRHLLPVKRGEPAYGSAHAVSVVHVTGGRRLLVAGQIGSKRRSRAALWRVLIHGSHVGLTRARLLPSLGKYYSSQATAVNTSGWVVGQATTAAGGHVGFVWERGRGLFPLDDLVPRISRWAVNFVLDLNDSDELVAQGYRVASGDRIVIEGMILRPVPTAAGKRNT